MNSAREFDLNMTRRQLFGRSALGLGTATMAQLLGADLLLRLPIAPMACTIPPKQNASFTSS